MNEIDFINVCPFPVKYTKKANALTIELTLQVNFKHFEVAVSSPMSLCFLTDGYTNWHQNIVF